MFPNTVLQYKVYKQKQNTDNEAIKFNKRNENEGNKGYKTHTIKANP